MFFGCLRPFSSSSQHRTPILKPVDFHKNEPVWVITDGSKTGVSAIYGQGKDWEHYRPAGFLSKKFTNVQYNYHTHEKHMNMRLLQSWKLS